MEEKSQAEELQSPEPVYDGPDLYPGMTVEVLTLDNNLTFVGKVERFNGEVLTIRDSKGLELPPVLFNKKVKLRCFQGADTLVIHGKICGSNRRIWKLDRLQNMFSSGKRAFFRQRVSLPAQAICLRLSDDPTPGRILDVSAGGLLLRSRAAYRKDDLLLISDLRIVKEEDPFSFVCRVQRVSEAERKEFMYGCQFEDLSPKEQDRLLRTIFIVQRKDLQHKQDLGEE